MMFKETYLDVLSVVNKLPRQQRKIFLLLLQGYTPSEATEELAMERSSVGAYIFYGRKKLKKLIQLQIA